MRIISPSLLAANFGNIEYDISIIENAGVDRLHLDIMDGHFVPNLTFGPMIIKDIRKITKCHIEAHLMIEKPHETLKQYVDAGSDTIIFHLEASNNPENDLKYIKENNVCAGIAINPETDEKQLLPFLDYLDYILVMSVNPGKGGQSFIPDTINKMKNIVSMREERSIIIGVDGGVNMSTISRVFETKIDIAIIGSGLFKSSDVVLRYEELMNS